MKFLDKSLSILADVINLCPKPIKFILAIPIVIIASCIFIPVTLFMLGITLIKAPFEAPPTYPTPREIYLRTGIKVNGYNGYKD